MTIQERKIITQPTASCCNTLTASVTESPTHLGAPSAATILTRDPHRDPEIGSGSLTHWPTDPLPRICHLSVVLTIQNNRNTYDFKLSHRRCTNYDWSYPYNI